MNKFEFVTPIEKIVWGYYGCSDILQPFIERWNGIYDKATIYMNDWPLRWCDDYPKAYEEHKRLGYGKIINDINNPLSYIDIKGIGYHYVANGVDVEYAGAPGYGVYDLKSYFE